MPKKKINKRRSISKVVRGKVPKSNIPTPEIPEAGNFTFSFRLVEVKHRKFGCCGLGAEFYTRFIERLSLLSGTEVKSFQFTRRNPFKLHPIEWETAGYEEGFSHLHRQYEAYPAYQFSSNAINGKGRVYGLLADTLFYIIWIDPEHQLYNQYDK